MNIVVKQVSYAYDHTAPVLEELNVVFDYRSTAIIGQNGAGKTTFVKLLKGLIKPTKGSIILDGQDITVTSAAHLAKKIGLVFQNPDDQLFKRTVLDEVMFGPLTINMSKEEANKQAFQALKLTGLEEKRNWNPHDLSYSEKKLLCLASILAMDTEVIILDEPTIAMDYEGIGILKGIIFALRQQGKLIITITHDMRFVAENFERVLLFSEGTVLMDDNPRGVFSDRERLQSSGLEAPEITDLGFALGYESVNLTIDELIHNIQSK